MNDPEARARLLRRIEITTALLLSLAGLLSAWASYQAALWGGEQAVHYAKAGARMTEASRLSIIDGQLVGSDGQMFMAWLEAASDDDAPRMTFFERRFSPELRAIFEPWRARFPGDLRALKLDPDAPNQFPRPQHDEGRRARALQQSADTEMTQGDAADRISDRYIAATVVLSTVLFLGGISPLLKGAAVRMAMLALASIIGIAALVVIAQLPVETA